MRVRNNKKRICILNIIMIVYILITMVNGYFKTLSLTFETVTITKNDNSTRNIQQYDNSSVGSLKVTLKKRQKKQFNILLELS